MLALVAVLKPHPGWLGRGGQPMVRLNVFAVEREKVIRAGMQVQGVCGNSIWVQASGNSVQK